MHQIAYLTPKGTFAWKCPSLQAHAPASTGRFAPVAYAIRNGSFFLASHERQSPGVLWLVPAPIYRGRGSSEIVFSPALTAQLAVDQILAGDAGRD